KRIRRSALIGSPCTSLRELNGGAANSVRPSLWFGIRPPLTLLAHNFGDSGRYGVHAVDEVIYGESLRLHRVLTRDDDHSAVQRIFVVVGGVGALSDGGHAGAVHHQLYRAAVVEFFDEVADVAQHT